MTQYFLFPNVTSYSLLSHSENPQKKKKIHVAKVWLANQHIYIQDIHKSSFKMSLILNMDISHEQT